MGTSQSNPFTPGFGTTPLFLAGRNPILTDMRDAFDAGPGNPDLCTILIGARGSGKTALLSGIEVEAGLSGWITVHAIAGKGLLEAVYERACAAAQHLLEAQSKKRLTGLEIGQVLSVQWENDSAERPSWYIRMCVLLDELKSKDIGLLITVDEVRATIDEMVELASNYQLFVREGRKVALVMAGLPVHVSALVTNESVSFLRRATHRYLERISDEDVELAFRLTVESSGKVIHDEALHDAAQAIQGFPYMLQLVGYHTWLFARNDNIITPEHLEKGVRVARRKLEDSVFSATYRELSEGDRKFLRAMLEEEEPCRLSAVARRMGKSNSYASSYRLRLLNQGVIDETLSGRLRFALPFFKEWLVGVRE